MRIRIMIFYLMRIWFRIQLINFDTDPDFYLMRCWSGRESRLLKWCGSTETAVHIDQKNILIFWYLFVRKRTTLVVGNQVPYFNFVSLELKRNLLCFSCVFKPVRYVSDVCLGLYPNVCMHKEKRKVLTTEARAALIHKSSVNCSRQPVLPTRQNWLFKKHFSES